ncbi:MAG: hypothetical protein HY784_17325, partial [Chloroflexi bacterium]|nr:hypothetical protein [Chloroflexota bacterium]
VAVPDLAPGASATVDSDPITIANPPVCGSTLVNTAVVTGFAPDQTVVSDEDTAAACTPPAPGISIVKNAGSAADGQNLEIQPGDSVVYHYLVTNTGNVPLTDVSVTDDAGTPGDPGDDFTVIVGNLAAGASTTVDSAPIVIGEPPVCAETLLNTAVVTGEAPGQGVVSDSDTATVCAPPAPGISLIKTAGTAADGTNYVIQPGDPVVYHYLVTNTGNVPLTDVSVTDDNGTPGDPGDDFTLFVPDLPVGIGRSVASAPIIVPDPPVCGDTLLNQAVVTGSGAGQTVSDDDDATVCTPADPGLTIVKTAGAAADGAVLQIQPGDTVIYH